MTLVGPSYYQHGSTLACDIFVQSNIGYFEPLYLGQIV